MTLTDRRHWRPRRARSAFHMPSPRSEHLIRMTREWYQGRKVVLLTRRNGALYASVMGMRAWTVHLRMRFNWGRVHIGLDGLYIWDGYQSDATKAWCLVLRGYLRKWAFAISICIRE